MERCINVSDQLPGLPIWKAGPDRACKAYKAYKACYENRRCAARTQLAQEGGVLLAARRQVLLRKLQRLLRAPLAHQLDQALLLQVERQLVLLLQDLRAAPRALPWHESKGVKTFTETLSTRLRPGK